MSFENKPGFGALFKVDDKKSPNGPDYRGTFADPNGVSYEIAGWLKDGKRGEFLSLKVSLPRERPADRAEPAQAASNNPFDDEIPF